MNECLVNQQTWGNRISNFLFPQHYLEPLPEEEGFSEGDLTIETFIYLDWLDRLRVLLSGKLKLRTRTKTDVPVNRAKTIGAVSVLAPWRKS